MKKIHISTDRILLIIIVLVLWYSTLLKACEADTDIGVQPEFTMVKKNAYEIRRNSVVIESKRPYKNE